MSIQSQKQVAATVLAKIREYVDETAIVAGGAPRDWFFGRECHDIDLFFYYREDLQQWRLLNRFHLAGLEVYQKEYSENAALYEANPNIQAIYELEFEGMKVQLIHVKKPTFKELVDSFPLSICQAWFDGKDIHTTRLFDAGVKAKTIFKTNKTYANGNAYIRRILNYYPEFEYLEI